MPATVENLQTVLLEQPYSLPNAAVPAGVRPARQASLSRRIPELDGLRGLAISFVLLMHYFYFDPYALQYPSDRLRSVSIFLQRCIGLGWSGVDLFFVLSGFLIGGILLEARHSPNYYRAFYARRFFRIIPVYFGWIAVYLAVMWLFGGFLRAHVAGGEWPDSRYEFVVLLLFLQNFGLLGHAAIAGKWFQPTWSLAVEEQFYLVAPFVVRFFSKKSLYAGLGFIVVAAPFLRLWVHRHFATGQSDIDLAYTLMPCRADALAIGILLALLWKSREFRDWISSHAYVVYVPLLILFGCLAALAHWSPSYDSTLMESVGFTCFALFYASLLLLSLIAPAGPVARLARMSWLRELGRVSYCLYVIHLGVALICRVLLDPVLRISAPWQRLACDVVAAVISYAIARASWQFFERPLLQRGQTYRYEPSPH